MADPTYDPLARALAALERLSGADPSAAQTETWREVRAALLEAQRGRRDLLSVSREARAHLAILSKYWAAVEQGDADRIIVLAGAIAIAEAGLARALSRIPPDLEELQPSGEGDDERSRQ